MFVTINGEEQEFYATGYNSANPPSLMPVGRTFTGDMTKMQVFYGRGSGDGSVELTDIEVDYVDYLVTTHWTWEYRNEWLQMKWSDVWLSNVDRYADGKLDRGSVAPYTSSASEGAWLTNHQYPVEGDEYFDFIKIIAAPDDAELFEGDWYTPDGDLIGWNIWGSYAVIMEVDETGLIYSGDTPAVGVLICLKP